MRLEPPPGFPDSFADTLAHAWAELRRHGDYGRWQAALSALPEIEPAGIDLNADAVRIGDAAQIAAVLPLVAVGGSAFLVGWLLVGVIALRGASARPRT